MTWAVSWSALQDTRKEYKETANSSPTFTVTSATKSPSSRAVISRRVQHARAGIAPPFATALGMVSAMVGGNLVPQSSSPVMDAENQRLLAKTKTSTFARDRSGASTASTTAMAMAASAIPTTPAANTISSPPRASRISSIASASTAGPATSLLLGAKGSRADSTAASASVPSRAVGNLGKEVGRKEMLDTTAMHFDAGRALNGFGFVTSDLGGVDRAR